MQDNYKKLGKNTLIMSVGSFAQKLLSFIFVPFYTHVLSTSDYGTSDLIVTACYLLWPVFTLLIDEGVMRFLLDHSTDRKQVVSIGAYINLLGIVVMLACSPLLLLFNSLKGCFWLFILYFISYTIDNFSSYILRGLHEIPLYSISGILSTGFIVSLNIIFLVGLKWKIEGYLLSYILAFFITSLFKIIKGHLYKYIISIKYLNKVTFYQLMRYSIPLMPNSISWWISNSSDKFMLTFFCGVAVNGVYAVAYKIPSIINIISNIFMSAWQISAVDDFGTEENRKFFTDIYIQLSSIFLLGVIVLIIMNKFVSSILFSKEFFVAWKYIPVLLGAAYFQNMSAFLGTIYTTAQKTNQVFVSTVIAALVNIILNIILIPHFGGYGAATATMFSYFVVWVIRAIDSRKIIILDINVKQECLGIVILLIMVVINTMDLPLSIFINLFFVLFFILIKRKFCVSICKTIKSIVLVNWIV